MDKYYSDGSFLFCGVILFAKVVPVFGEQDTYYPEGWALRNLGPIKLFDETKVYSHYGTALVEAKLTYERSKVGLCLN